MQDDLNILELIKHSPTGAVDIKKKMFVELPVKDREITDSTYQCSLIVSIVKYNERRINVSFIDLPKNYKLPSKIDIIDDDSLNWHYTTMNPIKLASLKGSFSRNDF